MNLVLLHLLLVLAGVVVALGALWWYSRVHGGFLYLAAFLVVALALVLAGFGAVPFPGLENTQ